MEPDAVREEDGRNVQLFDEAIAESHYGFDLLPGVSELRPESPHVDIDGTCFDQPIVAPDALEEPVARNHAIPILDQIAQQLELSSRQPHRSVVDFDAHRLEIRREVSPLENDGARGLGVAASATQGGSNARGEFACAERFRDVVVSAHIKAGDAIIF